MLELAFALLVAGQATYYDPGVMREVYVNRLAWGHVQVCPACIGKVAMLEPEHIGKRVYLQRPGEQPEGPFLVVDCAAAGDRERLRARGLVVEVDWQTAQRWQMRGPVPVQVLLPVGLVEREPWQS